MGGEGFREVEGSICGVIRGEWLMSISASFDYQQVDCKLHQSDCLGGRRRQIIFRYPARMAPLYSS